MLFRSVSQSRYRKDTTAGQPSQLMIDIKSLDLKHVHFKIKDRWRGEDQSIQIGRLHLKASEINLAKKRMLIQDVYISEPLYNIFQYTGIRPDSLIPVSDPNTKEHWNKEGWHIEANAIQLEKGMFQLDVDTIGTTLPYFDGEHFQFANINGNLDQVRFAGEKITAALHLSTKERSGFEVSKLHADMQLDPSSMSFKDLSILTPYSRIQNYFAMDYRSFTDDMSEFIHKVNMRGSFRNSIIDLKDIAFFAPELKEMPIKLTANGIVTGTVDDLKSNNISLKWGRNSELKCKIDIKGLPDIESTRYTANNIYINTNPTDFYKIHNQIKSSMGFDLAPFQSMKYMGNASMYGDHLKTKGKLITSIGSAQAEVDIAGLGSDAINIKTSGDIMQMELGKLFQFNDLRNVNAHFNVASKNGNTTFDTKVHSINYNDYTYSHLDASGNYTSGILTANLDIVTGKQIGRAHV